MEHSYLTKAGEPATAAVPLVEGQVIEAEGDFAYVRPAAARAIQSAELAIEATLEPDADTIVFRLLTLRGEPGLFIVHRTDSGARAEARVGHFGDADTERRLLRAFARRFEALRSGDARP